MGLAKKTEKIPPIHTYEVDEGILSAAKLYSDSCQNTQFSIVGYSLQCWLSGENPAGQLYRSRSVDQLLYNHSGHAWIKI